MHVDVPGTVIRDEAGVEVIVTSDGAAPCINALIAVDAASVTVVDLTLRPAGTAGGPAAGLFVLAPGAVLSTLTEEGARSAGPAGGL